MSAMLQRTFNYISSSLSAVSVAYGISQGPTWAVPTKDDSPCAHLPQATADFLVALSLAETPAQEREIVNKNNTLLEQMLSDPKVKTVQITEALVRTLVCHILGHDVSFMKLHALQLAEKGSILEKKMAYLACCILLDEKKDSDMILLLTNTLVKNLASQSFMEQNMALVAITHLVPADMAPMIIPILLEKVTHSKDFLRKKSLICMQHFIERNPEDILPQLEPTIQRCLADPDPGVVFNAIQAQTVCFNLKESVTIAEVESVLPMLVAIQEQILGGRLPKEYEYKGQHGPWIQVVLVKLIGRLLKLLGSERATLSKPLLEAVSSVILRTMDSATLKEVAGQALIFECISCIASMDTSEEDLWSRALYYVNKFLQSKHNNLKYMSLSALESLFRDRPPRLTAPQEESVLVCLEHQDESIQRKTLSLLYVLANKKNVQVICGKLVEYIRGTEDHYQRRELISKAMNLAEKYSPGLAWYADIMLKLLQNSEGPQREELLFLLYKCLSQQTAETQAVGRKIAQLAKNICDGALALNRPPPTTVQRLYVWALAEFHSGHPEAVDEAITVICSTIGAPCLKSPKQNSSVLLSCISALFTLASKKLIVTEDALEKVNRFVKQCEDVEHANVVVDSANELAFILPIFSAMPKALTLSVNNSPVDTTLSFMDESITEILDAGNAEPYDIRLRMSERPNLKIAGNTVPLRLFSYQTQDGTSLLEIDEAKSPTTKSEKSNSDNTNQNVWSLKGRTKPQPATQSEEPLQDQVNEESSNSYDKPQHGWDDLDAWKF